MKRLKRFEISGNPFLVALLGAALAFATPSFATNSPVDIADEPVFVDIKSLVPTNIVFLADDSGSMTWTHAPEGLGDVERACWRGADGVIGGVFLCSPSDPQCRIMDVCGYPYPNPYPGIAGGYPSLSELRVSSEEEVAVKLVPPPLMAAGFNRMAYHPEVTYEPPVYGRVYGVDVEGKIKVVELLHLPSMGSSRWNQVGWPEEFSTSEGVISRPVGAPVVVNMRGVTTRFPQARTYLPDQRFSLQLRYMSGSSNLAELTDVMPMHYFKTKVKWCRYYQSRTPTPDGNPVTPDAFYEGTLYLGSASPQYCQDDRTEVYKYPYYYNPRLDGNAAYPAWSHMHTPSFELVVLDYANETVKGAVGNTAGRVEHTWRDENGVLQTVSRTHREELENYANWYAYYSNRTAATRTVASFALAGIEPDRWLRLGFATVNKAAVGNIGTLTEVKENDPALAGAKFDTYKALLEHGVTPENKGTPLKTALHEIRREFDANRGKERSFIIHSCQRNYVVALTDGGWNDAAGNSYNYSGVTTAVNNQDRTVQSAPPRAVNVFGVDLVAGMLWPKPILEGELASNTLSDVSLYAWLNELRKDDQRFDVDLTANDPASWKHINTLALAYAVEGTLSARNPKKTLAEIASGAAEWPVPYPVRNTNPSTSHLWRRAVDDLWHAAISGFGVFTAGIAPRDFTKAIDTGHGGMVGLDVISRGGTFAELGLPLSRDLDMNGMYGYSASFTPNYGGTVQKRRIVYQKDSFEPGTLVWDAAVRLAEDVQGSSAPLLGRNIFTGEGISGMPFLYDSLPPGYRAHLGANSTAQQEVINYLRGDRSQEENLIGGKYRQRPALLGDFVHASPAVVDRPWFQYTDPGYESFKKNNLRKKMIYAAGNDGMLHAFDDENGKELWAFIPPDLFRSEADRGIINLTHSREGDPRWQHYFYVDATPRVVDVDINPNPDVYDWRTMLIGGMGKGGTSYYALDITRGDLPTGAQGSGLFKWTFTDDNMGFTYGRALMLKTRATDPKFKGKWVAIFPSGLNNGTGGIAQAKPASARGGDGKGRIFFVDLVTGEKLHEIITDAGTDTAPSGLVYIRAFVESSRNQLADAVYGGDQLGNFWRFDLTSQDYTEWKAVKLAVLENDRGTLLPVNTEPRMEITYGNGSAERWVMIGTGRSYHESDLYDWAVRKYPSTAQGMFAFKDGTLTAPEPDLSKFPYRRTDLEDVSLLSSGGSLTGIDSGKKGWVHFFDQGYQIITNPDSLAERIAYVANRYVPSAEDRLDGQEVLDVCETSPFEATIYERHVSGVLLFSLDIMNDGLASVNYVGFTHDGKRAFRLMGSNRRQNQGTRFFDNKDINAGGGVLGDPRRSSIRFINR
ncbi:MAG: hypothetical protein LBE32_05170 [Burkholderiales bacterium]|jgi:type IV pilus assembly protein PilY1|nr:hypothetical protein [Burkholderiales bacterium]